ncbi:SWIM zinc finger family protein, partial [Actinocorallia lasiicapitis]
GAPAPGVWAARRDSRVESGLAELARWLRDQVARGLAGTERVPYAHWDEAARRLVDAQAPALASRIRELGGLAQRAPDWPARLLEEYGLLHLLIRAHQRRAELPASLHATVRARIGYPVPRAEALAGERVRDTWFTTAESDSVSDGLVTRRTYLRGAATSRNALILTHAPSHQPIVSPTVLGSALIAELAFYPGAQPLRALIAAEVEESGTGGAALGTAVDAMLDEYAGALAHDPWLDRWPALLADVRLARAHGSYRLVDPSGAGVPLLLGAPWRLLALSGGAPFTVAGEWTPTGLVPLAVHHPEEGSVPL